MAKSTNCVAPLYGIFNHREPALSAGSHTAKVREAAEAMSPCAATETAFSHARRAVALMTASGPSSGIGCLGLWKLCKFSEDVAESM